MSNLDSPKSHNSLVLAQEKMKADMEILRATEGWDALSERQQKIIENSLYVQSRAERTGVEAYEDSQSRTAEWYCHAAIWSLEREDSLTIAAPPLDNIEESFYDGEYFKADSFEQLRDGITKVGFPSVVHISQAPPPLTLLQTHTFLALGVDRSGDIVVWEKEAERLPFQRSTLSNVYRQYLTNDDKKYFWGVRPLRSGI